MLAKLRIQLQEREATIAQLQTNLKEAQSAQHGTLGAQPPTRSGGGAEAPRQASPPHVEEATSAKVAPTSIAVVLKGADTGELVGPYS